MLLSTEVRRTRLNCWKIIPIRRRIRRSSGPFAPVTFAPSKTIVPLVGSMSRLMQRRSEDLPEPESPIRTTNSPRWMSRETPSIARVPLG